MLKEFLLSMLGGVFGIVEISKQEAAQLEQMKREALFDQIERVQRLNELRLQQEERLRHEAILRRQRAELYQKQQEIDRLAYQQDLLRRKQEDLTRQQALLNRERNSKAACQHMPHGRPAFKLSNIL